VVRRSVKPLAETGQLELVEDGHEPAPGVRLLATPGHTAGHVGILVYGQGEGGIIAGDIAHHPMEFEHPEWSPRFDADPAQAARTRTTLVERAEAEGLLVLGGHLPPPHAGRIVRVEQRRVYQPLSG
jgi:glyoxylase-like metal-dependent hydrolase (beta-lactamase superfamily II)